MCLFRGLVDEERKRYKTFLNKGLRISLSRGLVGEGAKKKPLKQVCLITSPKRMEVI